MYYRKVISDPFTTANSRIFLRFGAVDWQTTVYFNRVKLGTHTGGYSGFSFEVTDHIESKDNEIIIFVYDPSNYGSQPYGKQNIQAISAPGGDTYTPSSGIWQTVWMEEVPKTFIEKIKVTPGLNNVTMNFTVSGPTTSSTRIQVKIQYGSSVVTANLSPNTPSSVTIPSPRLWTPDDPFLYHFTATLDSDAIQSYFALRTFKIGTENGVTRPLLNNKFLFLAGWLDQS